jgi:5-methylcytosine-specific restriction endonuclease McrA
MCEKCGIEVASEVHHLLQQKDADKKGYVGTVHKNHKANLMNLCEKCHNDEHHSSDKQLTRKMKTTSGEYIVM